MLDPKEESFQTALQMLSLEYDDNNWIIDLGNSCHFSENARAFVVLEPSCPSGTACSTNHAIQGQGSVNVPSSSREIKKVSFVYWCVPRSKLKSTFGRTIHIDGLYDSF